MRGNPFKGAGYFLRGFSLIRMPGIRPYVLIPLVIYVLLFSLLMIFGAGQFSELIAWLLPAALDWLAWLLWPLFALAMSTVVFFAFIQIGNLIAAPFNAVLSEAVEAHLIGKRPKENTDWQAILSNLWPALLSEFKKIGYFLKWALPILILFAIPVVNIIAPFLWIAFSTWMLAFEYADYPMGNHGILFDEQKKRLKDLPLMVLGFGGAALLMMMIPIVNFLAMPTAVAGATVMWLEGFERDSG